MSGIFTRHLRGRLKRRNIGAQSASRLMSSARAKYLGGGKYKATRTRGGKEYTVV